MNIYFIKLSFYFDFRLRDLSAHEKHEMAKLQKDIEEKKQENTELLKSQEKLKQRVTELEADCADLHEQVCDWLIVLFVKHFDAKC